MPGSKAQIYLWSNNSLLERVFLEQHLVSEVSFLKDKDFRNAPYHLFLIDLSQELSEVSQKLISVYKSCRDNNQKLIVALIHPYQVDTEKNIYFTQLLDNLGGESPLHRLVFVKDLFQYNLPLPATWLDKFLTEAVSGCKIIVSSKGKNNLYPLPVYDMINGILKIFFLSGTAGKTFWLVGDPMSDLELAYLIKKNLEDSDGPPFEIEATGDNSTFGLDLVSQGNISRAALNWRQTEDGSSALKVFIQQIDEDQGVSLSDLHKPFSNHEPYKAKLALLRLKLEKLISKHKKGTASSIKNGPALIKKGLEFLLTIIIFIYLCTSLSFVGFTALSLKQLETSVSDLRAGEVSKSVEKLNQSVFYGQIGEASYSFVAPFVAFLLPDAHTKNYNLFAFEHYGQTSLASLQQTYSLADKILRSIGDSTASGLNYSDISLALRSNLVQVYENLTQIDLLSQSGKLPLILDQKIKTSAEFGKLKLIEEQILQLTKIVDLIPSALSGGSVKNIVILFQNSHELRSTGGTIDFILALSLDQGRLVSHKIYQEGELNSLAVGTVEAPPLIKLYSGVDDWKLRDMNYNPDFPQTAENISWFVDKTLKFKPDIILAVNDHLIKNLLDLENGAKLSDVTVKSADLDKELSVTGNSPLYRQLAEFYLNKLFEHQLSLLTTGRVLAKEVGENQLLFWTADSELEETILDQQYSGSVLPHLCHPSLHSTRLCLSQTTYLNESNFSLVPVDQDLSRSITHKVWLEIDKVQHEYLIDYQFTKNIPNLNRALTEVVQLYAPVGSILNQVTLDSAPLIIPNLIKQTDRNLDRFQIPISFSFNSNHELSIKFSTILSEPALLPLAYSLTEYREPGLTGPGVKLQINYPDNARPAAITAPVITGVNNIVYDFPLRTSTFGVSFLPRSL